MKKQSVLPFFFEGFEEVEIKFDETAERRGSLVAKQTQMYLTVAAQILGISFSRYRFICERK